MVKKPEQKHFTIPLFIPLGACPFRCIFCDQHHISGTEKMPGKKEIVETIESHLATIPEDCETEAGYFGGTFTGLPEKVQREYLEYVQPYIQTGRIKSIRLSTRPDFITREVLSLLKEYNVRMIELGAQSFDDEVLMKSGRGHTAADTVRASEMIRKGGFSLGLQMMVGLPGDSPEKVAFTAREIVRLGAAETRIYPLLIIRGTAIEKMYESGKYTPLTLEEAVQWTKKAMEVFEESDVKVIRVGLHNSASLASYGYVAGPAHVSIRELVMTEIWRDRLAELKPGSGKNLKIKVNPADINNAIGYNGSNRRMLQENFQKVTFVADPSVPEKKFHADHY